jgi:hypothetical protein
MLNMQEIEACITPETPVIIGKLHAKRYLTMDGQVLKYRPFDNKVEYEEIDCFCSMGRILSCAGATIPELDEVQDQVGLDSEKAHAKAIWARWGDLLSSKFGMRIDHVETIIRTNDMTNAWDTTFGSMKNRARKVLAKLKQLADDMPA